MKVFFPLRHGYAALALAMAAVPCVAAPASAGRAPVVKMFQDPGSFDFTVPKGVSSMRISAIGGAGGGGGNNSGPLTGGGGGGGGGAGFATCTVPVEPGQKLSIVVSKGGSGGTGGGTGLGKHGGDGGDGGHSFAGVAKPWKTLANGGPGKGGRGGMGSWAQSGNGGLGGAGASSESTYCDYGSDRDLRPGEDATKGEDGRWDTQAKGGRAGYIKEHPCQSLAGSGGTGGWGAIQKYSAKDGRNGHGGCVVLTYTP